MTTLLCCAWTHSTHILTISKWGVPLLRKQLSSSPHPLAHSPPQLISKHPASATTSADISELHIQITLAKTNEYTQWPFKSPLETGECLRRRL